MKKSRLFTILASGMILPAAFFFSVTADIPHLFIIIFTGIIVSLMISTPVHYTERSIIYSIVTALALSVILDNVFPVDEHRFFFGGRYSGIITPFLLYMAMIITFFESTPHTLGLSACFSIPVVMFGGNITSFNLISNKRLPFFSLWVNNIVTFLTIIVIIEVIFLLIVLHTARSGSKMTKTGIHKWQGRFIKLAALPLIITLTIGGLNLFHAWEDKLHSLELFLLNYGRRFEKGPHIIFNKQVDLNRTISPELEQDRNLIVIRALGKSPPGYLRGRVYTQYSDGKWTNTEEITSGFEAAPKKLAFNTFYFPEGKNSPSDRVVHIYPTTHFSSDVLLVPGNSVCFDIVAEHLNYSPYGIITADNWEKDGGYTAYVPEVNQESAYPGPQQDTSVSNEDLLSIPKDISEVLNTVKVKIETQGNDNSIKDYNVIVCLLDFFHKNFKYEIRNKPEPGKDPVVQFLKDTKSGHCELFASSMTLLLRKYGIPARYITGFICEEPHPSGRYYVSRLGCAHAWLEAYLRDEKKWILVEPTPVSGIPNFQHEWGIFESWADLIKQGFQQVLSDMRRGYFAKAITTFFSALFGLIWMLIRHPLRGPMIIIPLLFFLLRKKIKRFFKSSDAFTGLSEMAILLRKEFEFMEANVSRKTGLPRSCSTTIEEWKEQVCRQMNGTSADTSFKPVPSISLSSDFTTLIEKYQSLRYRQFPPETNEINEFKTGNRKFISEISKQSKM